MTTTYTITIGGEDTAGLTAIRASEMAHDAHRCGQPYMVHDQDGRCVDRGNRTDAVINATAATAYDVAVWSARDENEGLSR